MNLSPSLTSNFAALFEGRQDAYGTDYGGVDRVKEWALGDKWPLIYLEKIQGHLEGGEPIGVYPLMPDGFGGWHVKWGCVDLDVKAEGKRRYDYEYSWEAEQAADDLIAVLAYFGIKGWKENTKSNGWHVWVFATDWVCAKTMRRSLIAACNIAHVPTTEVNPKSEGFDDETTLGNYVRLPYAGASERRTVHVNGVPLSVHDFTTAALAARLEPEQLTPLAALYTPPHYDNEIEFNGDVELDEELRKRLSGLAWTILHDGPLEGQDRSGMLYRLASVCRDDDLDPDETFAVVRACDATWGQKYATRRDGDDRMRQLIRTVYNATDSSG